MLRVFAFRQGKIVRSAALLTLVLTFKDQERAGRHSEPRLAVFSSASVYFMCFQLVFPALLYSQYMAHENKLFCNYKTFVNKYRLS